MLPPSPHKGSEFGLVAPPRAGSRGPVALRRARSRQWTVQGPVAQRLGFSAFAVVRLLDFPTKDRSIARWTSHTGSFSFVEKHSCCRWDSANRTIARGRTASFWRSCHEQGGKCCNCRIVHGIGFGHDPVIPTQSLDSVGIDSRRLLLVLRHLPGIQRQLLSDSNKTAQLRARSQNRAISGGEQVPVIIPGSALRAL